MLRIVLSVLCMQLLPDGIKGDDSVGRNNIIASTTCFKLQEKPPDNVNDPDIFFVLRQNLAYLNQQKLSVEAIFALARGRGQDQHPGL